MNFAADIEVYQASDIQVDATIVDVSEVDSETDKEFLREKGANILMIEAKADFAIKKIIATIQGRASLEKGKIIAEVQDRFRERGERGLTKWYKSLGITVQQAICYSNAHRAVNGFTELFDGLVEPQKILECSDSHLQKIQRLPTQYREEVLAEIAVGEGKSELEIAEFAKQPEVKLSKAQELLAAAKERKKIAQERWEEVKADPEIPSMVDGIRNPEYVKAQNDVRSADSGVNTFEQQIAELQKEIEGEKLKAAEAEKREAATKAELQKLKFDDAKSRAERVKRLTSSLTVGVPQTLADIQKFFAEKEHYPEDVRKHVLEQATQLANYIGDQL